MSKTLFDCGADLLALEQLMEDVGDDSPETEEALRVWFDELSANESAKVDQYRALLRKWASEEAVAESLEDQYAKVKEVRRNRQKRMKDRMKQYLEFRGVDRIITDTLGEVKLQKNGGKLPIVPEGWADGLNPAELDPKFTKFAVDTEAVRKFLEVGGTVPFASLGERGFHIRVK